jgi:Methyltransferase domain
MPSGVSVKNAFRCLNHFVLKTPKGILTNSAKPEATFNIKPCSMHYSNKVFYFCKMKEETVSKFLAHFLQSLQNKTFVKLTLSKPKVKTGLKNIYVRLVEIKNQPKLSFTYHYETRDEVKNYDYTEGGYFVESFVEYEFLNAILFTIEEETTLTFNKKGENPQISTKKIPIKAETASISTAHNKEKKRLLDATKPYFHALEITDAKGQITPTGQKKFKQINKYIEIIDSLLKDIELPKDVIIADFGSGKGYLTFALYDFLMSNLAMTPLVLGFELRENLVNFCNNLADKNAFNNLKFIAQDINDFETEYLDMLIALHACDIATDIAIAKGIKAHAKIIIVAPCCHKQIRKQLAVKNEMQPILKHGILEERQAELLTDGIRALLLEAHGYKTKVFEFISTEHTPKNVMIVGVKNKPQKEALAQVARIKEHYGIEYHHLEKLLMSSM